MIEEEKAKYERELDAYVDLFIRLSKLEVQCLGDTSFAEDIRFKMERMLDNWPIDVRVRAHQLCDKLCPQDTFYFWQSIFKTENKKEPK